MSSTTATNAQGSVHNVFVYGSLLADDVVRVLLKRVPQSSTAILHNYHRYSIKGRVYPAILLVENNKVIGKVLSGITDPELHILDVFEDDEYERRTVDVSLMDSSERVQAYTYVWADKDDPNLYGEWDLEEWKQSHMKDFLKMSTGFMEELELPESKTRSNPGNLESEHGFGGDESFAQMLWRLRFQCIPCPLLEKHQIFPFLVLRSRSLFELSRIFLCSESVTVQENLLLGGEALLQRAKQQNFVVTRQWKLIQGIDYKLKIGQQL